MMGRPVAPDDRSFLDLDYVGVKAPHFSFTRLGAPTPRSASRWPQPARWPASAGLRRSLLEGADRGRLPLPHPQRAAVDRADREQGRDPGQRAPPGQSGVKLYATRGTADFLTPEGIATRGRALALEGGQPNALDCIRERKVDLVINIPKHFQKEELTNDYIIRRTAGRLRGAADHQPPARERLSEALDGWRSASSRSAPGASTNADRRLKIEG